MFAKEAAFFPSVRDGCSILFMNGEDGVLKDYFCMLLILNVLSMVEATGVELSSVLITRKLLIPGTATTPKKAPPLYVYCTKFALESRRHHVATTVSHRFAVIEREKTRQPPFRSSAQPGGCFEDVRRQC
jgi:hypothetical protein